jgi:RNA polymerase sigma factor (sigma-70 family)
MKSTSLHMIARLCRNLAGQGGRRDADEMDLLARFTSQRDEAAFAALLDRHGRLVWGVCRGLLPNDADAEDAFQATFVALFRGAATIRHSASLAPWLHRAATRIAQKARLAAARRRARERRVARAETAPTAVSDDKWQALDLAMHDEINRLPAALRVAFVLCVLEGHRHQDAAARLGVPVGTVSARVSRARTRLMKRLSARGLTPAVAAAAVSCLAASASASAPTTVLRSVHHHLADGFASMSRSILDLAATSAGGTSMTTKWLSMALLAATLLAAAGGVWHANPQPQPNAQAGEDASRPPVQAEQARADRVDSHGDPLPDGALARLGTVRLRHGAAIGAVAFSPDGQLLATGGHYPDNTVRLWDGATGKPAAILRGHTSSVTSLAFSPDGKTLLSSSGDFIQQHGGETKLWDVVTRRERRTFEHSSADCVAFSPDGREVASANFGYVSVWDVATGKGRSWSAHPGGWPGGGRMGRRWWIYAIAYSPDGRTLVTASDDQTARLWDTQTGKKIHEFAGPGEVYAAAFSSDGKRLAISSSDKFDEKLVGSNQKGTIRLFDPATGKLVREVATHTRTARCLAFFAGDRQLAVGSYDGGIEAWDVATGKKVRQLAPRPDFAACLALSPDGERVAAAGWGEYAAVLCNLRTGQEAVPPELATSSINAVLFAPDGRLLANVHGSLSAWDPTTGEEERLWKGKAHGISSLALSPDGKTLAAGLDTYTGRDTDQGVVLFLEAATGREVRQITIPRWGRGSAYVAYSPDGRTLAVYGRDEKVYLVDVASSSVTREVSGPQGLTGGVAFSPDGRALAAWLHDSDSEEKLGEIGLWDAATGKLRLRLRGHYHRIWSLTFSPDGALLASITEPHSASTERALLLWDVKTGKPLVHLEFGQKAGVHCPGGHAVAFSPDGRILATAGLDETVSLWEIATGVLRRRLSGHTGAIYHLAFSADGRLLASAGADTTVLVWEAVALTTAEQRDLPNPQAGLPLKLWEDLAAADGVRADRAIRLLAAAPDQALPLLRARLRPVAPPDMEHINRLVADLDSIEFSVRDRAAGDLDKLWDLAEPAMQQALARGPSLETRRRIEGLLANCAPTVVPTPERLRVLRALEVLERIGTTEAHAFLETQARGAAGSRLTREAAASAQRLAGRLRSKPSGP